MSPRRPWLPATAIASALAAVYLVWQPWSVDLAAHVFRAELFDREGLTLWNGWWYGGHHTLSYSVVFPPLASLLGPRLVGALSAVAAAGLFSVLARDRFGESAWLGSAWFAAGTATLLLSGRMTFALGVALGLAALLAHERGRPWLAVGLGLACAISSPVAALFLAVAGVAVAVGEDRRSGLALAASALAPVVVLAALFPEGGDEPFVLSAYLPVLGLAGAALVLLEREDRVLRWGAVLYALGCTAAYVLDTPVGGNAARLGALAGGPMLACALWPRRRVALVLVALPLVFWQWTAAVRDVAASRDDPSVHASYYRPLLDFLAAHDDRPLRIEIPFTRLHWESARVAPSYALARGWERQLDRKHNGLFYRGALTPARYEAWLDELGVRYVALADAALDHSALREAQLLRGGLPYLRPVWRSAHWRVWEVRDGHPLVEGAASAATVAGDRIALTAEAPGDVVVRVRFTPYWKLVRGAGCVERTPDGWTRLALRRPGRVLVEPRFALSRVRADSPRCG